MKTHSRENSFLIRRRALLSGLLVGISPLGTLVGCGGGSTPQSNAAQAVGKPLVSSLMYQGDSLQASVTILEVNLSNVEPVADRFNEGALCHRFDGISSSAAVADIPDFASGNFAISFWERSTTSAPMKALTFGGKDSKASLSIEFNHFQGISVFWNAQPLAILGDGLPGALVDGIWHHVLVQRIGQSVELFVDGLRKAEVQVSEKLVSPATLILGNHSLQGDLDDLQLHNRMFNLDNIPGMVYSWQLVKPSNRADSMAGYYPFNGNAINDTGHGADGVAHNVSPAANRFGDMHAAYAFDGSDSYIELNDYFDAILTDFAVGFWLRSESMARMVALGVTPGESTLDFVFNDHSAMSMILNGISPKTLSFGLPGELTNNAWHFVLAQRQGIALQVFVDGILRVSMQDATPVFGPTSRMRVGRGSDTVCCPPPGSWNGLLDDVQVYARSFTQQEIKDLEGLQFRPQDGSGSLTFHGRLWLLGGWRSDDAIATNSEVWSSVDGYNWSLITVALWEGRHTAGYLVFNDKMWIIGGDKNRGHYQNDVWSSLDGLHWELVTDTVPWADRATHQVLAFDNRMWLLGGQKMWNPTGLDAYNDVYSSTDGSNWTLETSSAAWSPRGLILGSVVHRGRMWVIGGGTYDIRTYKHDVWSSADGIHWDLVLEQAPWLPRQYHFVTVFHDKIWVLAGANPERSNGLNDVWYSTDGLGWAQLSDTPWLERHAPSIFVRESSLWLTGGSSTRLYNDIWKLTYAA
jgi:hypothetical protein